MRASSPLLGRSYQSNQSSARQSFRPPLPMENPQLRNSGSTAGFAHDPNFDEYAFDTRSQLSLAFGVVDDMRGIGFPQLDSSKSPKNAKPAKPAKPTTPKGDRRAEDAPKKKPSRLDLSLLFPKPKPAAAPLLSPQRYTNSPSPVTSEFSEKPQPAKLTKPRSRGNVRASIKEAPAPIPEEPPFPRKRVSTRKPAVDWFDVPLEQIIRLGETLEVDEEEDIKKSDRVLDHPNPVNEAKHSKPIAPTPTPAPLPRVTKPIQPIQPDIAKTSSPVDSRRSSRTPSRVSNHTSRGSRGSENHYYRQPLPPSNTNRPRASLQTWQSEGDLRSAQKPAGRLLKKKSSSTFHTKDLTKNSVLSLSSSEDEGTDADEDYGEQLVRKAAPSRGPRDSFATNDYVEPEICHAEAVVATKGYQLTRLGRANSNVSSVSSDSRSTQRRPIPSRADSVSSMSRSSVSTKMYGSSAHFDVPLIEEPEEQAEEVSSTRRPRLSSQSYSDLHSAKRRSRIIAVTRQEESLLEAMRLRNGRITPSIFKDIEPGAERAAGNGDSESVSAAVSSPEPVQTQFDTSFLRLSAAMRIPPIAAPNLAESESLIDKDSYSSHGPTPDTDQKNDNNNNAFTASPRLSLAYSETPSSSSTMGHASPVTPTLLPIHRFSHQLAAPPPSHALPPLPDEVATRRHSRRRTDSSDAIVLEEGETEKLSSPPVYPLWAVKWGRDPDDVAIAH